ncbi:hypothetical protein M2167_000540 [Streptomyces sp. SPB4]|nr:hypothetical protein [Streptomyces sp. SPB4]
MSVAELLQDFVDTDCLLPFTSAVGYRSRTGAGLNGCEPGIGHHGQVSLLKPAACTGRRAYSRCVRCVGWQQVEVPARAVAEPVFT